MKRWILGLLIIVISIGLTGCFKSEADETKKEEAYKTVKIEIAELENSDKTVTYSGVVKSDEEKKMSFKSSGRISKILVDEGDVVNEGDALAVLDTTDLELQVGSSSNRISASEKEVAIKKELYEFNTKEYEKSKKIFEVGAISKTSLEASELSYEQARLSYEISIDSYNALISERNRLSTFVIDGTIRADYKGIVDQILVHTSEFVSPGQPAFILRSKSQIISTYVTNKDKQKIEIGQKVNLTIDGDEVDGVISFIDDAADAKTHSFRVEIGIIEKLISNGVIANIEFIVGEQSGIWIPLQSIQTTTIDFVYLVDEDRATKRALEIVEVKGDLVLVKGLEVGDEVVVSGMKTLIEGMLVSKQVEGE